MREKHEKKKQRKLCQKKKKKNEIKKENRSFECDHSVLIDILLLNHDVVVFFYVIQNNKWERNKIPLMNRIGDEQQQEMKKKINEN